MSRSAINYQSGGATRVVGIMTAVVVAVAVLRLAPLARFVPKATLAAARRLGFFTWFPPKRAYVQGKDEDSATLAAIRSVYRELGPPGSGSQLERSDAESDAGRPLYYLL